MDQKPTKRVPHILIVDDVPENLRIAAETLTKNIPCDLAFATHGHQALRAVEADPPDLILLDVMMPDISGIEVCETLKKDSRTAGIPILFLTAKSDSDDIVRGFEAGAADYIAKPFNGPELLARVKTHLKIRESAALIEQKNEDVGQLVRILCHDLTNPVGNLKNLLFLSRTEADFRRLKKHMDDMADTALALIDIVRKLRALEEGKVRLELRIEDLSRLCNRAIRTISHRLEQKGVRVKNDIPPGIEVRVEPTLFLHSVLCNLLTNAVKFSPRESVVCIACREEDAEHVRLSVSDRGVGMTPDLLSALFDPARQTSRPGTEGELGTGFGMMLARKIVALCGGTIAVQSRDAEAFPHDHGTTVSLLLSKHRKS